MAEAENSKGCNISLQQEMRYMLTEELLDKTATGSARHQGREQE